MQRAPIQDDPHLRAPAEAATSSACLDELTLGDFLAGGLSEDDLSRVEAHLDGCLECSAIVSVLAGGHDLIATTSTAAALGSGDHDADALGPGTVLGRYEIVAPLGEGAMGTVYVANDPELHRRVAIKLVHARLFRDRGLTFDPTIRALLRERMQREAQAMARITHPNVVTVFDVGRIGEDLWIAMERVEGQSLRAFLRSSTTTATTREDALLDLLLQAARGLAAAHDGGIVHRDFKPDNVLVGDDRRVRVTDFGVARSESSDSARPSAPASRDEKKSGVTEAEAALTQTGALIGTPAYMAPEQLRGADATPASDQFAFAVTAYEALFGQRPFAGTKIAELVGSIERGPRFPRTESGARTVSARTRAVLARALSYDAAARFPDMHALIAALTPAPARSLRSSPIGVALLALLASSVAIAIVAVTLAVTSRNQAARATAAAADMCTGDVERASTITAHDAAIRAAFQASGVADAPALAERLLASLRAYASAWSRAHKSTCEATHVKHEQSPALLDARMECLNRRLADARALSEALEHANRDAAIASLASVASLPRAEDCMTATDLASRDARPTAPAIRMTLDEIDRTLTTLRARSSLGEQGLAPEADALVTKAEAAGYRPTTAEARLLRATIARRSADFTAATEDARQSILLAESARDDRAAALGWIELAATSTEQKLPALTLERTDHALAAIARIGTPKDLEASALFLGGIARTHRGDLDDAEKNLRASLDRRHAIYGDHHIEIARTLSSLANVLRLRGDLATALTMHRDALAMDELLLGATHPSVARHHHNIGGVLRLRGDLDEALASYDRARSIEVASHGDQHRSVGQTENSIGLVHLNKARATGASRADVARELTAATTHLTSALAILKDHPDRALALENLGLVAAASGDHPTALTRFTEAEQITRDALGPDHERIASILGARAKSERALHEHAAAKAHSERALAIAKKRAPTSAEAASILHDLEASAATAPRATATAAPSAPSTTAALGASAKRPPAPAPRTSAPRGGAYTAVESTDTER